MSYFNHSFSKRFLGTGATRDITSTGAAESVTNPYSSGGLITTAGTKSVTLSTLNSGYFMFADKNYEAMDDTALAATCCPIYIISSALQTRDKIGPFAGGYKETNKSKLINPKYVSNVYKVEECVPQQSVISIGNTPQTSQSSVASLALIAGHTETYVNGTYTNINLTGGGGTGAKATVIVAGNVVTSVVITSSGQDYVTGNVLTLQSAAVPTAGALTELVAGTSWTYTATASTVVSTGFQGGTTESNCCYSFLCGETYYLRIDVKGSPALRALNHNAYQTLGAYTGCCPTPAVTTVDPTTVYLNWAKQIITDNYLNSFIMPVVYDYTGVAWYAPGTTVSLDGNNTAVTPAQWWTSATGVDNYAASAQAIAWTDTVSGACQAGMRLFGAYVETVFGNCSFQVTDFYEKEPVRIYASLTDLNGDPCAFEGLCVYNDCLGHQGIGFGETVVRDLILSEAYLQNFFHSDIRIREITLGSDILDSVVRADLYSRYYIQHVVPRFNNPSGTFDHDRYMLEIITPAGGNATLDTYLDAWLGACIDCVTLEVQSCTACDIVAD